MFVLNRRYMKDDDDGTGGGGQGGSGSGANEPTLEEKINAAVDAATKGLKAKNGELLGKLKDAQETLKSFEGLDADHVRQLVDRFQNDEIGKLLKEGKWDDALAKKFESERGTYKKQIDDLTKDRDLSRKELSDLQSKVDRASLSEMTRRAMGKAKAHESAHEDAIYRVMSAFTKEDGHFVRRDADGNLVMGAKGPQTVDEYIEEVRTRDLAPHWWPTPTGMGSKGGGSGGARSKNPWAKDTLNLTEQGKIMRQDPQLAARLKQEAGAGA